MNPKGLILLSFIIGLLIIIGIAGGVYYLGNQKNIPSSQISLTVVMEKQSSPAPQATAATSKIQLKKTTVTPAPKALSTPFPSPTANPCGLGKPTPVTSDPSVHLDWVTPSSGKVGETIILKGSGFGKSSFYFSDPTKFLGGVSFYGSLCGYNSGGAPLVCTDDWDYSCWTETELKVKVPGVSSGSFNIEVMSSDGKRSNRINFQVIE